MILELLVSIFFLGEGEKGKRGRAESEGISTWVNSFFVKIYSSLSIPLKLASIIFILPKSIT